MDLTATALLPAEPSRVFAEVADLSTYPSWLGIVHSAEPVADATWGVELGARFGPLRRTKRVRMVRTVHEPAVRVRFERDEEDGRSHSAWVLDATIEAQDGGHASALTMHLHYGGAAWLSGLDLVLRQEVRRSADRLQSRF